MKALERSLGLPAIIAISVGTMLGSGLFVLPGLAFGLTGPSVWLAYGVAGLFVFPAALSKSELATAMPVSGGTYVYIDRTFGPLAGTVSGLGMWLSLLVKSTFALVGFSAYLAVMTDIPLLPISMTLLCLVVMLNIAGVRKVGSVQTVVVATVVICLTVLSAWGATTVVVDRLDDPFPHGGEGFLSAVAFVYISYAGVTKIAAIAEEVKNPERNLPMGILLSLVAAAAFYSLVVLVLVGNVPPDELVTDLHPIYTMAHNIGGPTLGIAAAVLGIVTLTSMANAGLLSASRFPFAMSRDKLLPSVLSRVNDKFLTPTYSILLSASFIALALILLDVPKLAKLGSAVQLTAFAIENLTVIALRETKPQWYRPHYKSPFYPWMQGGGILVGVALLFMLGWSGLIGLASMTVPGVIIYFAYGRRQVDRRGVLGRLGPRHDLLRPSAARITDLQTALPGEAGVVVPLFGHERSPESLVEIGVALAEGRKTEVVHLTDIPEQIGLDAMLDEDLEVSSLRRRLSAMAEDRNVDIEFDPVVTRDVVKTVFDVSNRVHCDWVVMDWQARAHTGFRARNPLGWLINHLPSNLAFFKDAGIRNIREILVFAEPGPNDALVAGTADHLAQLFGARLTFVRFVKDDADPHQVENETAYVKQLSGLCVSDTASLIVRGRRETDAIAAQTGAYDLLVKGAPPAPSLVGLLRTSQSDQLTRRAVCSVLRLKSDRARSHDSVARAQTLPRAPTNIELADYLDPRTVDIKLASARKEAVFTHVARAFDRIVPSTNAREIEEHLWDRERAQNTAVGHGVAMPHATIAAAAETHLGVFTTASPISWDAPDGEPVDVFFATLGPPHDRATHLLLLARIAKLLHGSDVLDRLRAAPGDAEVMALLSADYGDLLPKG